MTIQTSSSLDELLEEWRQKAWLQRLLLPSDFLEKVSTVSAEDLVCHKTTTEYLSMTDEVEAKTLKIGETAGYQTDLNYRPQEFKNETVKIIDNASEVACNGCSGNGQIACPTTVDCRSCNNTGQTRCGHCNSTGQTSCGNCNNTGQTRCGHCNSTGQTSCGHCNSTGQTKCGHCNSTGQTRCGNCNNTGQTRCGDCNSTGQRRDKCIYCDGHGRVRLTWRVQSTTGTDHEICMNCSGSGKGMVNCSRCSGNGFVTCNRCNGNSSTGVCNHCRGNGFVTCNRCNGRPVEVCNQCSGNGSVTCNRCNGRPVEVCNQCSGNGSVACNRCNGNGTVVCDKCMGSGSLECRNCEGAGRLVQGQIITRKFSCSDELTYQLGGLGANQFKNGLDGETFQVAGRGPDIPAVPDSRRPGHDPRAKDRPLL